MIVALNDLTMDLDNALDSTLICAFVRNPAFPEEWHEIFPHKRPEDLRVGFTHGHLQPVSTPAGISAGRSASEVGDHSDMVRRSFPLMSVWERPSNR